MNRTFAAILMTAVLATGAWAKNQLLIGDERMNEKALKAASSSLGTLVSKNRDGFWTLQLKSGVTVIQAQRSLRAKGVDFAFEPSWAKVDESNLYSVRRHIRYAQARFKLRGGKEGFGESGVDFYEALEHYLSRRVGPDGTMSRQVIQQALDHRDKMAPARWTRGLDTRAPGGLFSYVGPARTSAPYPRFFGIGPVSGRKNEIAYAPSNPNHIWVASAGGGVWRSIDGGVNWIPRGDQWANLQTSSIAVQHNDANVVYVGTGDYVGFFQKFTRGILKTTNAGATWSTIGHPNMRYEVVNKILINPNNTNQIVAFTGKGSGQRGGIYRSVNGGTTWTWINGTNFDWDDADRGPDNSIWAVGTTGEAGNGGIIVRSTDFGATWTTINNPVSTTQQAMDIAVSKVSGNTVYLLATGDEAIYKTTDSGASWSNITGNHPTGPADIQNFNWGQKTYDYHISTARDGNVDLVFVGLITISMSRGGTTSWVDIGRAYTEQTPNYIHSDQHSFAMNPSKPNEVLIGCDGGIFRFTQTAGTTSGTITPISGLIHDLQIYKMSIHPTLDTHIITGTQDNSSPASRGNLATWTGLYAGDGGWSGFDPSGNGRHFTTSQNMSVWLYTSLTDTQPDYISPSIQGYRTAFIAPVIYAGTGSQIFAAGTTLLRYTGTGNAWTNFGVRIASDSTTQYGTVNVLRAAPTNRSIIYSGSSTGEIYLNRVGTTTATATPLGVDSARRSIGDISVASNNAYDVIIGIQNQGGSGRLLRCTNVNVPNPVWVDVSGTGTNALPNVSVNAIARDPYEPNRWYVGTDAGLFMTVNAGQTWSNMNVLGLPNVHVNDIVFNGARTVMYVATFGRGVWRMAISNQATPYSLSGTVTTATGAPYSNIQVNLLQYRNHNVTYTISPNREIPDANLAGIYFPISIPVNQPLTKIAVYYDAEHTYPTDLTFVLVHPDGHGAYVRQNQAGSLAQQTVVLDDFNGKLSGGTWQFWAQDNFIFDTGRLKTVRLTIYYDGYVITRTTTTNTSGFYSFPNMISGGTWRVLPMVTGKTFNPSSRTYNFGPSVTGANFRANN